MFFSFFFFQHSTFLITFEEPKLLPDKLSELHPSDCLHLAFLWPLYPFLCLFSVIEQVLLWRNDEPSYFVTCENPL